MPRPGPRPYECVRRAWHSDRHQPIRGSLIQEIFRVVNEIHSSGTRKNKEWQKKLPIVVLKAEEIMYSKANSEAEYMDIKSLRDRANDAINTIIRRDGSTETGEFLQPCIEAALNLGCTPRRASRSQRNCNPECYLRADTPERPCVPPNDLQNPIQGNHIMNSNFITPATGNLSLLGPNFCGPIPPKHTHNTKMFPILAGNFPPCGNNPSLLTETYALSNSFSVYPLYYESLLQSQESQFSFSIPPDLNFGNPKPATTGHMRTLSPCNVDGSDKLPHADLRDGPENPPGVDCDLSLRLGPLSVPCISIENSCPQEVEEVGSSTSRERRKSSSDLTPWIDKEFSFFSNANADDSLGSYSSKWSSEAENMNVTRALRKRKAIFGNPYEDRQIFFQPKFPSKPPDWKCG